MRRLKLFNSTNKEVGLNVEPRPDMYQIPANSFVELESPLIDNGGLLEVAVDDSYGELTLLFWDAESDRVTVFDAAGVELKPAARSEN